MSIRMDLTDRQKMPPRRKGVKMSTILIPIMVTGAALVIGKDIIRMMFSGGE